MSVLAHQRYGQGQPLVVTHGLFGSADNWRSQARIWSDHLAVWCLDLRNHGRSFHSMGMSYTAQAEDILRWMDQEDIEKASFLGHSMGGKAVMELAQRCPSRVERLILADIAPLSYAHSHQSVLAGLRALHQEEPWHERRLADQRLADFVDDVQTRLFLLTNLIKTEDGLRLRLGIEEIDRDYSAIIDAPPAVKEGGVFDGPTLAIRGTQSDYVPDECLPAFRQAFPALSVVDLQAGHWLHADQAAAFAQAVLDFMVD